MIRFFFCMIFFCFIGSLQGQFEDAFRFDYPERAKAIDTINSKHVIRLNPEMQLQAYKHLQSLAETHHDEQASILSQGFKYTLQIRQDSALLEERLQGLTILIRECSAFEYRLPQLYLTIMIAEVLRDHRRSGAAMSYYLRAYDLAKDIPDPLMPKSRYMFIHGIARSLYDNADFARARAFIESSSMLDASGHDGMLARDLLSQVCLRMNDLESSRKYIVEAMDIFMANDSTSWYFNGWRGIFMGNLGKIEYAQGLYEKAIPLFEDAMRITGEAKMNQNVAAYGLLLADSYIKTNQQEKIQSMMPLLRSAVHQGGDMLEDNYLGYYRLLVLMSDEKKSLERSKQLLDSVTFWTLRLDQRKDQNLRARQEMAFEMALQQQKEDALQERIRKQKLLRTVLWMLLGMLTTAAVIIIIRMLRLIYSKQQETQTIKAQSDHAITQAHAMLEEFRSALLEKSLQLELLESKTGVTVSDVELQRLRESTILTENDWTRFKHLFDQVHTGYITRLKSRFPSLTAGDIRLIVLNKLNLNTKEIASALGVGDGAVRTARSRLLKKLTLPDEASFEEVIHQI